MSVKYKPALFTRMSRRCNFAFIRSANALIEFRLARSSSSSSTSSFLLSALIFSTASLPLASSRQARITRASRKKKMRLD